MKHTKSHNIYRSDSYPDAMELLIKARFWMYEWIIFYLMFTTLISLIYFLISQEWTYTFLSIILTLTVVFSVLVIREIQKTSLYRKLLFILEKQEELSHSEIFKKMAEGLAGKSEHESKLRRTKEHLERIAEALKKTQPNPFEQHWSVMNPAFYDSIIYNPSWKKSDAEIILALISMDKHEREELFSLAQSLEKKTKK